MRTKVKREKDCVLNEATGQYEWVWVESTRYIHDEEDRVLAALDFLKGDNTPEELVEKYHNSNIQVLFSRVGRYLSENRLVSLQEKNDDTASGLIHHSDRGSQYCSSAYVKELKAHNIMISMTQNSSKSN